MAYCDRCDRSFGTYDALYRHERDSQKHNVCDDCGIDYWTYEDLRDHWITDSQHNFCTYCDEDFSYYSQLGEHNQENHEWCDDCEMWLDTASDMEEHDKETHNFCADCNRYFSSVNALKNHLNSSKHQAKTFACPGKRCNAMFISTANLVMHLESGGCRSGATRHTVNQFVAERDTGHFITNPNRLITGPTETWATERAWNGNNYECYFCHKEFRALTGLNQHLASPAHERMTYRCPPQLSQGCRMQFKTLSALCQHIESGSCGVIRFKVVQDNMQNLVRGMNRLTYY